jgi:hypothetical protein
MRKYAQYAAAVAGALFVLAVMLWANRSAVNQCRTSELPYFVFCDQIAKQFIVG